MSEKIEKVGSKTFEQPKKLKKVAETLSQVSESLSTKKQKYVLLEAKVRLFDKESYKFKVVLSTDIKEIVIAIVKLLGFVIPVLALISQIFEVFW